MYRKTKKTKFLFPFILMLFLSSADVVLAQFELKGEFRPRTEMRHGYKTLPSSGDEAAFFTEQRSRLLLGFRKELYEIGFSLQDVRIWGSQNQLNKSDGLFSVHEAWGKINFSERTSLKAGRQELVYDDQRILGNVGWTAQGRSHDVLLFMVDDESRSFHAGFAFNQDMSQAEPAKLFDTYYSGVQNYKTLQYLWYSRRFTDTKISMLVLNNGVQAADSSVKFTQTIGLTGSQKISDVTIGGTVYYQTGKDPADSDVSALLASLDISYSGFSNTMLTIGTDYLSGTASNQGKNHTFNPLYGTHHKFYGFMDYFYVGNPHNQPAAAHNYSIGLVDLYLKSNVKIAPNSTIGTAVHEFYSPVRIIDPANTSTELSSRLGTEIDLVYSHTLSDEVKIQAGYSHLFATPSLEVIKGGSNSEISNWAWLMLSIKPSILM